MNLVAFNPELHARYLQRVLPVSYDDRTKGLVAVHNGQNVGIILLKDWTFNSVAVHVSIQMKMCLRTLLPEMFNYVFETCDRKVIVGLTPDDGTGVVEFNKHVGFNEVYRIKNGFADGVDHIVFEMRREDCRYITKLKEAA